MARSRSLRRLAGRSALALLGVVLVLVVFLTQTPWGREWVLREILRRVEGAVQGEIQVDGISSSGLLGGFTLRGVRISGEDGRPFLVADSVRVGVLSPRTLLSGDLILNQVEFWSPQVTLERLPTRERMNVVEIFASRGGEEAGADSADVLPGEAVIPGTEAGTPDSLAAAPVGGAPLKRRRVELRGLKIHGGSLEILLPLSEPLPPGSKALVARDPEGGLTLRRYAFHEIELELSEASILNPQEEGERYEVESLAFQGRMWESPFRITGARGEVRRTRGQLSASIQSIELPASEAEGSLLVQWDLPQGVRVEVQGQTPGLALADLHWIEPRLGEGVVRGPFTLVMDDPGILLGFPGTRLALPLGQVTATGGLLFGPALGLQQLALQLDGVPLDVADDWLTTPFPLQGQAKGDLRLSGSLSDLEVDGDLELSEANGNGRIDAVFSGILHLGSTFGVTDFEATLAPLEWGTFASLSPLMTLRGPGALRVEASGSLATGITLNAEATHVPAELTPSRVTARGSLLYDGEELFLDLAGEMSPLSFTTLRRDFPDLPLSGEIAGPLSLRGPISDLTVEGDLTTSAGPLKIQARFDARDPTESYQVDAEVQEFLLSSLVPALPDPTRLTGHLLASGHGVALDSLEGEATLFLRRGEVGGLRVDTAALVARIENGTMAVDTFLAETGVGRVEGGGVFGIASDAPGGDLNIRVESESLSGLRPFIMGEPPVILDELSPLERDWLLLGGADLDTIPTAAEVALEGAVQGRATLRGGIRDFSGEGSLTFQGLRFREEYVEGGELTFTAQSLPGEGRRIQGLLNTDSLRVYGQSFHAGEAEVDVGMADGRVRMTLSREGGEEYRGRGTYALDSLGGEVNLDELLVRLDTIRWNLGGPSSFSWSPSGIDVRDFRLIRPGAGGMRLQADGFLPFRGEGDFTLEADGLHLDRLARIAQHDIPLEGILGLRVRVTGTAEDPRMDWIVSGTDLRYGELSLGGLDSDLHYEALALSGHLTTTEEDRVVLDAEGSVPLDLRLKTTGPRVPPEGVVELELAVDAFPAALALAVVEALEEVQGTLSGDIHVGGTPASLAPSGELRLDGGSVLLPALGVRFRGAEAVFTMNSDARVDIEGSVRSAGTATVGGSVTLSPLTNPTLDLTVTTRNFLAVSRRDVEAQVTGEVRVLQSYMRPRVEGRITVERGMLQVEELARSAEVVSLADPLFQDVVKLETSLQPVLKAGQNPFLQNLMLDVELRMVRDSWLRGRDLNVEMGGDLQVFWDRTERDLAMVGELQAVRGVYTFLGRQFQVQRGTVNFLGTPGVNPNLDIEARHRLRRGKEETLEIVATVSGTLLAPRVGLSSDETFAISQSDLVSYLLFGKPTYALASGQSGVANSAAGSLGGAGANFALGTLSNQLGSVVARDFGLDFLAISQGSYADPFSAQGGMGMSGTVATTQVEIGQYITDDIFAALLWRPLSGLSADQTQFAGLRVEWRAMDLWTLEGFIEDRYSRSPSLQAGTFGYKLKKLKGFFFWREWGY